MSADIIMRFISLAFSILSSVFVVVIFCVMKFNDLTHIDKRLADVEQECKGINKGLSNLSVLVSNIDGYIKGKEKI